VVSGDLEINDQDHHSESHGAALPESIEGPVAGVGVLEEEGRDEGAEEGLSDSMGDPRPKDVRLKGG
jgi:hypothetical protein